MFRKTIAILISFSLLCAFPVSAFGYEGPGNAAADPQLFLMSEQIPGGNTDGGNAGTPAKGQTANGESAIGDDTPGDNTPGNDTPGDGSNAPGDGDSNLIPDGGNSADIPGNDNTNNTSSDDSDGTDPTNEPTVDPKGDMSGVTETEPVDEPVVPEEVIVVEYAQKTIWAKHSYTIPKPKKGNLPVVRWTTSNKAVASVASNGMVTAHNIGTAVINGFDENGKLRKNVKVTVKLGRDYTSFIAHKGYCAAAPENTLPAFRSAVRANFAGLELDVWESKTTSKKATPCLMVVHDKNLKKKTGKKMKAYKLNRANRKKYKIRYHVKGIKKYGAQTIPTLDESLKCIYKEAAAKGKKNFIVEIDVKNAMSDRAVKHVIKLVGKHRVRIISNNHKTLQQFKKFRKYKTTELWYCTATKIALKRTANIKKAGSAGFDGISIPFKYMNQKTIKLSKSYGMRIGGYGITKAVDVQTWAKLGCTRFNMGNKVFL